MLPPPLLDELVSFGTKELTSADPSYLQHDQVSSKDDGSIKQITTDTVIWEGLLPESARYVHLIYWQECMHDSYCIINV